MLPAAPAVRVLVKLEGDGPLTWATPISVATCIKPDGTAKIVTDLANQLKTAASKLSTCVEVFSLAEGRSENFHYQTKTSRNKDASL